MSFFDKLFGKSNKENNRPNQPNQITPKEDQRKVDSIKEPVSEDLSDIQKKFKLEIENTYPYYFSTPEMENVDFVLNSEDGSKIKPHVAFSEQFQQWQNIQSIWDRRSLIFSILDKLFGNRLELWQVVDKFTTDRYGEHALKIAKEHGKGEQLNNANFWYALGRAQFYTGHYEEAEKSLEKCLLIDVKHKRGRIVKADLLHSTDRFDEAHEIYDTILKESNFGEEKKSINLIELVGFKGVINSPIYALALLESHSDVDAESWDELSGEFYFSPHFRAKHAYYLIGTKTQLNQLKGFAKLNSLSQEMPWFKEGVINAYSIIDQLGLQDTMKKDKERLRQIIKENSWM